MIGKMISHYRITEKLGEGGMGVVYKAEDTKLKRHVALKFLPPHLTKDKEANERFIQEAQAASALDHQNICTIHEINETEDGQMYIVMAYYDGETLKKKATSQQSRDAGSRSVGLAVSEVIDIAIQIAEGLAKAHQKGIVHRDIKPANIMITTDGVVKIFDFGLAKLAGKVRLTRTGTTVGTIAYISPEQARGADADHRSDIWSFGVVLYEMITGQLPFRGEYDQVVLYSIMNEEPKPMAGLRACVPVELQLIVSKALAKNPDKRYEHIENVIDDLNTGKIHSDTDKSKWISKSKKIIGSKLLYLLAGLIIIIATGLILKTIIRPSKIDSIAVLPFQDYSKDNEQDYFTDGMTDALITELSKISALRVISRTSIMQYKKEPKSLTQIAKELNVDVIVEGSVQRDEDRIRITAKLIQTAPEKLLWLGENQRHLRDVLTLQKDMARAIANEMKINLTPAEEANLARKKTVNPEAYDLYLQGHYLKSNYWTQQALQKCIDYFLMAIEKDSSFAQACAGLADAYTILANYALLAPMEAIPIAKRYAKKGLELDETLAEVHVAHGCIKMTYDWDWTGAEESFERAIMLNPGCSSAYGNYAWFLAAMRRFEESIVTANKARELNPLSLTEKTMYGERLFEAGRLDEALELMIKALDSDPEFAYAYWMLGFVYEQKNMYDEAINHHQKAVEYSGGMTTCVASLGHAYAISGQKESALKVLNELIALSKKQYLSSYDIAVIYVGLGEFDNAIEWLEKAFEQRDGYLGGWINVDPRLNVLRSDKRFVGLLKRIGFKI